MATPLVWEEALEVASWLEDTPLDGAQIHLKSVTTGKYVSAELGGESVIVANRIAASDWETFRLGRMIDEDTFNFKVFLHQFVGLGTAEGITNRAVAVAETPGSDETFRIVRNSDVKNRVKIQALNGVFLQAKMENILTVDYKGNGGWGDDDPSVFLMTIVSTMQEEYQVTNGIPNKDLLDGTKIQLKSVTTRKYVCAEFGGGSVIVANRTAASHWETFRLGRIIDENAFNFKVCLNQFVGWETAEGMTNRAVAVAATPRSTEMFRIVRNSDDKNRVKIQVPDGFFLQAKTENILTVDYNENGEWGDDNPSVFLMTIVSNMQGEYQVTDDISNKDLLDGTQIQLKSVTTGKYVCAELGGGSVIVANRTAASDWETFRLGKIIEENTFNFKVHFNRFVGLGISYGIAKRAVAVVERPGSMEKFRIVRNSDDKNLVKIQAPNGAFLQAKTDKILTADYDGDVGWGDDNPSVFLMTIVSTMQGD